MTERQSMDVNKIYTSLSETTRNNIKNASGNVSAENYMNKHFYDLNSNLKNMYGKTKSEIDLLLKNYGDKIDCPLDPKRSFYSVENGFVKEMNGFAARSQEELLKSLNKFDLKCLPKFVENVETAPDTYYSFVKTNFDELVPYQKAMSNTDLQAKKEFMNEIIKLGNMNLANNSILNNPNCLFVTKDGKNIVAADWTLTGYLKPENAQVYYENVRKIIFD